jgi:hypothetical protein
VLCTQFNIFLSLFKVNEIGKTKTEQVLAKKQSHGGADSPPILIVSKLLDIISILLILKVSSV